MDTRAEPTAEQVDEALRGLAAERNQRDFVINRWLLRGFEVGVERLFGYGSFAEYALRVLDIGARGLEDRVRTARQLETLPRLSTACADGTMLYGVARELARVATAETEDAWLRAASSKTSREVQRMVSGRVRGDLPDAARKPEAMVESVVFRAVPPHARALVDRLRADRMRETGAPVDDAELLIAMAEALAEKGMGTASDGEGGRAPHRMSLVVCERCRAGEHQGSGIVATDAEVGVAVCDAQELGRVDVPR
ncbi:MAG: hypothetical protein AB7P00_42810, partial [Sandaracinaceae bacterium]